MELRGMKVLNLFYRFAPSAWGQGFAARPQRPSLPGPPATFPTSH